MFSPLALAATAQLPLGGGVNSPSARLLGVAAPCSNEEGRVQLGLREWLRLSAEERRSPPAGHASVHLIHLLLHCPDNLSRISLIIRHPSSVCVACPVSCGHHKGIRSANGCSAPRWAPKCFGCKDQSPTINTKIIPLSPLCVLLK